MIVKISNPSIGENEKTYLSADVVAGDTSLSVQNNNGLSADEYVVIGNMGEEQTELRKISSVSGNTTIVIDALVFPHSIDTPVTFIKYNKIAVYSATSKTGTYAALAASPYDIEVDGTETEIEDTSGSSTTWYKIRLFNSTANVYSDYSDPIQGSGYDLNTVRAIMDRIFIIGNDKGKKVMSEDEMLTVLNDGYQQAVARVMAEDPKFYLKRAYVDVENSYTTGTVSITDGSTTVTGVSTVWTSDMEGQKIKVGLDGYAYTIDTVSSGTSLTLTTAYNGGGDNVSGSTYTIYQDEYDIYLDGTTTTLTDLRSIYKIYDEDGTDVTEHDVKEDDDGFYVKRTGDNFKFCLNYIPDSVNAAGKWTILYIYQPANFDSMGDTPELPIGFDGVLQSYGLFRLKQRMGDKTDAAIYKKEFEDTLNGVVRRGTKRGGKGRSFRLPSSKLVTRKDPDFEDTFTEE